MTVRCVIQKIHLNGSELKLYFGASVEFINRDHWCKGLPLSNRRTFIILLASFQGNRVNVNTGWRFISIIHFDWLQSGGRFMLYGAEYLPVKNSHV